MSAYRGLASTLERFPYPVMAVMARFAIAASFGLTMPEIIFGVIGWSEAVLAALMLLGLFTRLAGLGLLGLIIYQLILLPLAWAPHLITAIPVLLVTCFGPGSISLDRLIGLERRPGAE